MATFLKKGDSRKILQTASWIIEWIYRNQCSCVFIYFYTCFCRGFFFFLNCLSFSVVTSLCKRDIFNFIWVIPCEYLGKPLTLGCVLEWGSTLLGFGLFHSLVAVFYVSHVDTIKWSFSLKISQTSWDMSQRFPCVESCSYLK